MGKGILIFGLALVAGIAFIGGVWGQENSSPEAFRGTITKIDLANKEIVVQNNDMEATFQWSDETAVKGPEEKTLSFEDLKQGMTVTVNYKGRAPKRIANRIDVDRGKFKTLKGVSLPFDCGIHVC